MNSPIQNPKGDTGTPGRLLDRLGKRISLEKGLAPIVKKKEGKDRSQKRIIPGGKIFDRTNQMMIKEGGLRHMVPSWVLTGRGKGRAAKGGEGNRKNKF